MPKSQKARHNKYVMAFEKLINNAKYDHETINTKPELKPNIEKYHYFTTQVQIGNDIYNIVLDTEQYKGESEEKPQTVHLYNIKEVKSARTQGPLRGPDLTSYKSNIQSEETEVNTNITTTEDTILNQNANGFFDSELKAIVLGSNFNFGTLPHEMAHFFLDKNFNFNLGL